MRRKKLISKILALALAVVTCTTCVPATVFATETTVAETQDTEVQDKVLEEDVQVEEVQKEEIQNEETQEEDVQNEETQDTDVQAETNDEYIEAAQEVTAKVMMTANTGDSKGIVGMTAKAGKSEITVTVNAVGDSGTAQLYRYGASQYFTTDTVKGMSKEITANGEYIADYECGSSQVVTFNRYLNNGEDNLYDKYYLIQNDKILCGPVYVSDVESMRSNGRFDTTKKGLTVENSSTLDIAKEMGVGNTVINMDLCTLIYANEDKNGNPIDNTKKSNAIEFESNGEMFYFNAEYVKSQDALISSYSKEGINVSLVLISWAKTFTNDYPTDLLYLPASQQAHTMGFNTSTERGAEYWVAAMEFLANRYSKSAKQGLVQQFIIGNEIDYTYDWYLMQPEKDSNGKYQRVEFNTFMEEYARTLRLANLAVKKHNSEAKVLVSLTHNWAKNCLESYGYAANNTSSRRYNSYAPKEILDWLVKYEGARGDYDWVIATHPYPIGTSSSNPLKTDVNTDLFGITSRDVMPVTGDWKTTPWVTVTNLEVYQLYLQQKENMYNGNEIRKVYLTETSICTLDRSENSAEDVRISQLEAAASIAQTYYRAANLECMESVDYFQPHDQEGDIDNKLGLMEADGTKKPAYTLWKYIDTTKSFTYANKYLKYIAPNATSYKELMSTVKSEFNWDAYWNEENIMVRDISTEEVARSIVTDKTVYNADEQILVTTTGNDGDTVELYKASDDVTMVDPIYYYQIGDTSGGISIKSGKTYDLIALSTVSATRMEDAKIKAGDYKVVLRHGDTDETTIPAPVEIKINSDYSIGGTDLMLKTDKDTYEISEPIVVTASGGTETAWVGLYKKDDKYGTGATTSIYWYYISDNAAGNISGKPTVIQNGIHNSDSSNPEKKLAAGDYILYLFNDSGYNVIKSCEFKVEGKDNVDSLRSVEYVLDNDTDGFANGVVTVKKDENNEDATDCVMYWADADGTPLDGYTPLAKFKLKGEVTNHEMYDHTIIPEGAKKLIAYAANGNTLSEAAVSVDLPEGCNYELGDDYIAEFQMISDVHVTTDSGATGEVKLANQHFSQMLEDVKLNSPDSMGIFINGDIANTGKEAEFKKVYDLYNRAKYAGNGTLPDIHLAIGNHDWIAGNPNDQFQKYAQLLNSSLENQPEKVYCDEVVNGYNFIYLGGEAKGDRAVLSDEQLQWFDTRMAEITAEDPEKPVFVMLHQPLYNTVAGTLPGQGWDGVTRETALKKVLKKYGQIVIFGGHSHWELDSVSNLYAGDEDMAIALNTASVGYLWSSYNIDGGEFADGSNGYYVRIYDDKLVFIGRDFENSRNVASAMIVVQKNDIKTESDTYNIAVDGKSISLDAVAEDGSAVEYESVNKNIVSVTSDGTLIPKIAGITEIIMTAYGSDTLVMNKERVTVNVTEGLVERIYGNLRYDTAFKVADALKEELEVDKFESIIIASGTEFADALAGSYLASVKEAPILLTDSTDKINKQVQEYVSENLKKDGIVYLLGGKKAVASSVIHGMENCTIKRLYGDDRYATNLAILKEAGVQNEAILVCTGTNYADSLSAAAAKSPILLVGNKLTTDQEVFLKKLSGNKYYIIGGDKAVTKVVEDSIIRLGTVERLAGDTRYETSVLVAKKLFEKPDKAVLVYSQNFPDGLSGGPLAVSLKAPVILTATNNESVAAEYTKAEDIKAGVVLGGPKLISDKSVQIIFQMDESKHIVVK